MKLIEKFITQNNNYADKRTIVPKGVMVHSTATPGVMAEKFADAYNQPKPAGREVGMHAFVDDTVAVQTLPWTKRAWHCGGSGNSTHIGFEMCEPIDWKTNVEYFKRCYLNAVELATYICKIYGLSSNDVTSHVEGAQSGIASNHADPLHWWKYFGYTMDMFRSDVKTKLAGGDVSVHIVIRKELIKEGSTGSTVVECQQLLNKQRDYLKLSFDKLVEDGSFGPLTTQAVKRFQKSRNLVVDGIVGHNTWEALGIHYGDVTGDGKVNAVDAQIVLKAAVGKTELSEEQKDAADMNADGKIDAVDAQQILKRAVGK